MKSLTAHAAGRMKSRGVSTEFLNLIFEHSDIERPANDNCRLYRVSRQLARALGHERLARFAVIWSDDTARVVTVLAVRSGRAGAAYRKRR